VPARHTAAQHPTTHLHTSTSAHNICIVRVHRHTPPRQTRAPGHIHIHTYASVWVCGCVRMWVCGCVSVCACVCVRVCLSRALFPAFNQYTHLSATFIIAIAGVPFFHARLPSRGPDVRPLPATHPLDRTVLAFNNNNNNMQVL